MSWPTMAVAIPKPLLAFLCRRPVNQERTASARRAGDDVRYGAIGKFRYGDLKRTWIVLVASAAIYCVSSFLRDLGLMYSTPLEPKAKETNLSVAKQMLDETNLVPTETDAESKTADGAPVKPHPNETNLHLTQTETETRTTDGAVATSQQINPLRFCGKSKISAPNNSKGRNGTQEIDILYQCTGPLYDDFAHLLHAFANSNPHDSTTWGRRPHPLPANKYVLIIGNSHTRQTMHAVVCQYADRIAYVKQRTDFNSKSVVFDNNSTLRFLINSDLEVANDWVKRLKQIIRKDLSEIDALVLGQYNQQGKMEDIKNTAYYKNLVNLSIANPEFNINNEPPTFLELSRKLQGPIVFVSSYNVQDEFIENFVEVNETIQQLNKLHPKVDRYRAISSRRYIRTVGRECASNKKYAVDHCHNNTWGHRCVGSKGGQPDLIAFDIVEALFELFEKKQGHL